MDSLPKQVLVLLALIKTVNIVLGEILAAVTNVRHISFSRKNAGPSVLTEHTDQRREEFAKNVTQLVKHAKTVRHVKYAKENLF
jgi:hypothetical protein